MRNLLLAALALLVGACVPDVKLDGKACNAQHPCVEGYVCKDGICLTPDEATAAPSDGGSTDGGQ